MFIDMLLKLIPKNIKAGVALILMIICLPSGLRNLGRLLIGDLSGWVTLLTIAELIIGVAAGIAFYYFQEAEDSHGKSMETLRAYYKDEAEEKKLKEANFSVPQFPEDPQKKPGKS